MGANPFLVPSMLTAGFLQRLNTPQGGCRRGPSGWKLPLRTLCICSMGIKSNTSCFQGVTNGYLHTTCRSPLGTPTGSARYKSKTRMVEPPVRWRPLCSSTGGRDLGLSRLSSPLLPCRTQSCHPERRGKRGGLRTETSLVCDARAW